MAGLDNYVKLMCHFNGDDASTTIVDDYSDKTITVNGNAQLDTSQKKFGTASLLLDGTGDFLSIADNSDFSFGSGDFTIDCWIRINSLPSSGNYATIFAQRATATSNNSLGLLIKNNSGTYQLYASFTFDGSTEKTLISDYAFTTATWYHIQISRESNWLGCFVNGVNIGSYYVGTSSLYNSTAEFKIGGSNTTTANYFNGWIDEFRLSKGVCRNTLVGYTVPTSAYETDSYCKLLLHMDGDNDSTTLTNSSGVDYNSPVYGTGWGYFDGTGDYLLANDHDNWNYGSGDFTIDFWVVFSALGSYKCIYGQRTAFNNNNCFNIYTNNSNLFYSFSYNGSTQQTHTVSYTLYINTLYHVAVVREGTALKTYVNGVKVGSDFNIGTNSLYNSTASMCIGAANGGATEYFNGYLDEFRISKGIARWTADFTPPTSEYASDAQTVLLLHMNGTDDSTTFTDSGNTGHTVTAYGNARIKTAQPRTITANGNAKIKTATKKFGTGSLYLDGTGDFLSYSLGTDSFYTGNFTIDCWVNLYQNKSGDNGTISDFRVPTSGNGTFYVKDNNLNYYNGTVLGKSNGDALTAGTFSHIAYARSGTTLYAFVSGVLVWQILNIDYNFGDNGIYIGLGKDSGNGFYGYIDEYRISKGIARFSPASFTLPTSEYSVESPQTGQRLMMGMGLHL